MTDPKASWAKLTDQSGYGPLALELTFADFKVELETYDIYHPFFGPAFQRAADVVIRMALTGQTATAKSLAHDLSRYACAIADAPSETSLDRLDSQNYIAVAVFLLTASMGWGMLDKQRVELALDRLPDIRQFSEGGRASAALAMLCTGQRDAARKLAQGHSLDPFVEALLNDDDVATKLWPDWRDRFPEKYAANKLYWHQMLFAARSLADPEKNPADWLLAQVS